MAKKVKAPVEINAEVKVKKTRVSVKKKDKKLDVVVDTPNTDVEVHTTEEEKKFVLDSRKLDVEVTKTNEGSERTVDEFYSEKELGLLKFNQTYPYRVLKNPSFGNIRINPPARHYSDFPNLRRLQMKRILLPSNVPDDSM